MTVNILDDFCKSILVNIGGGKKFGWKMSQILRKPRGDFVLGYELHIKKKKLK